MAARRKKPPEPSDIQLGLRVGDEVMVRKDHGEIHCHTVTREPWRLGHGAWVVGLSDRSGGYSLLRVVAVAAPKPAPVPARSPPTGVPAMTPTPDDTLGAIAERLLQFGEAAGGVANPYRRAAGHNIYVDAVTLADAWLDANPADDADPIDGTWLETVAGVQVVPRSGCIAPRYLFGVSRPGGPGAWLSFDPHYGSDGWEISGHDPRPRWEGETILAPQTRGQLRRLLAALGVPPLDPPTESPR